MKMKHLNFTAAALAGSLIASSSALAQEAGGPATVYFGHQGLEGFCTNLSDGNSTTAYKFLVIGKPAEGVDVRAVIQTFWDDVNKGFSAEELTTTYEDPAKEAALNEASEKAYEEAYEKANAALNITSDLPPEYIGLFADEQSMIAYPGPCPTAE